MDLPGQGDAQSWWWCRRCHSYTELMDAGDVYPQCAECHSRHVESRPQAEVALTSEEEKERLAIILNQAPQPETVSLEARLLTRVKKHLAADKKDLRKLARTGFWFCYADECRQITEALPARGNVGELVCFCCGAALTKEANWSEPVFTDLPGEGNQQSTQEKAA